MTLNEKLQDADSVLSISASQFKARCLALLDEVGTTGSSLIITKYGKPVAKLIPISDQRPRSLLGSVRYESEADLVSAVDEVWNADQ